MATNNRILTEADENYTKETCYGDPIVALYKNNNGKFYAIVHRARTDDYMLACGYDTAQGTWEDGWYDYKTEAQLVREEQGLLSHMRKILV